MEVTESSTSLLDLAIRRPLVTWHEQRSQTEVGWGVNESHGNGEHEWGLLSQNLSWWRRVEVGRWWVQGQVEMERKPVETFPMLPIGTFHPVNPESHWKKLLMYFNPHPTLHQYPLFPRQKNFHTLCLSLTSRKRMQFIFFPFKSLRTTLWENSCHCQLAEETGCCSANGPRVVTCIYSVCSPRYPGMLVSIKPACHLLWDLHTPVTPITSRHSPAVVLSPEECEIA